MENLNQLKDFLSTSRKVVIIPHRKPDADALGSCLALWLFLKKKGHQPVVISPTDYPRFLNWMPGNSEVVIYNNGSSKPKADQLIAEADLVVCLDFSSLNRIDQMTASVAKSQGKKLLIDHHIGKEDFADFELWEVSAAATAELMYDFIEMMGGEALIDLDIASCLYAGIMTDTGSFKFPNTSAKVHRTVAKLLDLGLDASRIHRAIHDNSTFGRLQLLGFALCNRLKVLPEYRIGYFALTEADLLQFDYETGDTEGLVNYALSVENIIAAALFIEDRGHVKMSFRSIGDFSVNELANQYFNGGGHKNAAGARMEGSLPDVVNRFLDLLPQYQSQLLAIKDI